MRLRRAVSVLALAAAAVGTTAVAVPAAHAADAAHYYVALGDSLSRGFMPGAGDTDQGYPDVLFATLKAKDPSLELVKLGCSGETTGTMIDGGRCADRYPVGTSQLDVAEQFLREHRGAVTYLTVDIGANDVDGCASGGSIDPVCVTQGLVTITGNLEKILDGLRSAAGPNFPRSAGMLYYDPFLASWLTGATGKAVAAASVGLLQALNIDQASLYSLHGFQVADVGAAFHSLDFFTQRTVAPYGTLPLNVAYICQYTFMCEQANIHANAAGYRLIAQTFVKPLRA